MKKTLFVLLSVLLVLASLLSVPAAAFADRGQIMMSSVSNTMKDSEGENDEEDPSAKPSASDILAASNGDTVILPNYNSYLSSYQSWYVDAPKKNSVYVYERPDGTTKQPFNAYHGTRVTLLAQQTGHGCVLYYTNECVLRAGWIPLEYLSWEYPGTSVTIGSSSTNQNASRIKDIPVTWSKDFFVGTKQRYTLLDRDAENVVEFTLDYDILDLKGASKEECFGYRTIYVNDGSGWVSVGQFECNQTTPYHVTVKLSQPMTIRAVATKSDCAKPDTFTFRQRVLDIYCAKNAR